MKKFFIGTAVLAVIAIVMLLLSGAFSEPHIHKVQYSQGQPATCESKGVTGEWKCTDCGKTLVASKETEDFGHSYDGELDAVCNNCGATREVNCSHSNIKYDKGYAPKCTYDGNTEGYYCADCWTIISGIEIIPAPGHTYDDAKDSRCNVCGELRVINCEHTSTKTVAGYPASCTQRGLSDGLKCNDCGEMIRPQETIQKIPHTYSDDYDTSCNVCGHEREIDCVHSSTEALPGSNASCETSGLTEGMKCKDCGEILIYQQTISAKGHTKVTDKAVSATCENTGLTEGSHCSVCSKTIVAQTTTNALGHSESELITDTPATVTTDGVGHTECTRCHKTMQASVIIHATGTIGLEFRDYYNGTCGLESVGTATDTTIYIPEYYNGMIVDTIKSYAFEDSDVKEVVVPSNVIYIEHSAFSGAKHLEKVTILGEITEMDNYWFEYCSSLREVILPDSLTNIGYQSFTDCTSLEKINLPASLKTIDEYAFSGCTALKEINFPVNLKTIENNAFENCTALKEVELSNNIGSIGAEVFYGCTSLEKATISGKIEEISARAFKDCSDLKILTIGDGISTIGYAAFEACASLKELYTGEGVSIIEYYAFDRCVALEKITFGDNVVTIHAEAFNGCENIKEITFGKSVEDIENGFGGAAFEYIETPLVLKFNNTVEVWNSRGLSGEIRIFFTSSGMPRREVICTNGTVCIEY